eukprot:488520_1
MDALQFYGQPDLDNMNPSAKRQRVEVPPAQEYQYQYISPSYADVKKWVEALAESERIQFIVEHAVKSPDLLAELHQYVQTKPEFCTVAVRSLPMGITENALYLAMQVYGAVATCEIPRDMNGQPKGFGTVTFSAMEGANAALQSTAPTVECQPVYLQLLSECTDIPDAAATNTADAAMNITDAATGIPNRSGWNGPGFGGAVAPEPAPSQPSNESTQGSSKLFVRDLSWDTTSESLKSAFGEYGPVEEAVVLCDKLTGKSKGYGFVNFETVAGAQAALADPRKLVDGRMISCHDASERNRRTGYTTSAPPAGTGGGYQTTDQSNLAGGFTMDPTAYQQALEYQISLASSLQQPQQQQQQQQPKSSSTTQNDLPAPDMPDSNGINKFSAYPPWEGSSVQPEQRTRNEPPARDNREIRRPSRPADRPSQRPTRRPTNDNNIGRSGSGTAGPKGGIPGRPISGIPGRPTGGRSSRPQISGTPTVVIHGRAPISGLPPMANAEQKLRANIEKIKLQTKILEIRQQQEILQRRLQMRR